MNLLPNWMTLLITRIRAEHQARAEAIKVLGEATGRLQSAAEAVEDAIAVMQERQDMREAVRQRGKSRTQ